MLEKLLQRIAKRASAQDSVSASTPPSLLSTGAWRSSSDLMGLGLGTSSALAYDADQRPLPAELEQLSPRSLHETQSSELTNAWLVAAQSYVLTGMIAEPTAYYQRFGAAHLAVALQLQHERARLHLGYIELLNSEGELIAAIYPKTRRVVLRPAAYTGGQGATQLLLRQRAENFPPPDPASHKGFEATHLHALLWFLGQAYLNAPSLVPSDMGTHLIELRRFPLLEPSALDVRHIALLHLFSAGAQSFEQLQARLPAQHAAHICADLCSLYFTGTLRLSPSQAAAPESPAS